MSRAVVIWVWLSASVGLSAWLSDRTLGDFLAASFHYGSALFSLQASYYIWPKK